MLVRDMIAKAARTFQDEAQALIASDEWLDYVREFLLDYSARTEQFRARTRLQRGQNPWLFKLPSNIVNLLWCSWDEETLQLTTYKQLELKDRGFLQRTGTPTHAYRDLSNVNELRLYPAPVYEAIDLSQFVDALDAPSDVGTIHSLASADYTFRFVNKAGVAFTDSGEAEFGHVVMLVRTDAPTPQPSMKSDNPTNRMAPATGKIVQLLSSRVEIAYAYTPELPADESAALATEIPLQDYNEMAGNYFLLNRAYAKAIETEDAKKADYYRQLYEQRVELGIRRKSDTWAPQRRSVPGRYF